MMPQSALKFEAEVGSNGRVELAVPFSPGARVVVFVIQTDDHATDLVAAAQSSTDFWDNPLDDKDWNNA